mgnify:CR=1 FL=1
MKPTPTLAGKPKRLGDFATLCDALDYAAQGAAGFNFYSARGQLSAAQPYRDLRDRARVLAAARPDRLLWGTNWPHASSIRSAAWSK